MVATFCSRKWTRVITMMMFTIIMLFSMNKTRIDPTSSSALSQIDEAKKDMTVYLAPHDKNNSQPLAKSLLDKAPTIKEYNIFQLSPGNMKSHPNTIVTAYFRVSSKHSSQNYDLWMKNFLSLQDPMVVFTQPELFMQIKNFRSHALDRTVIILMELEDIPIGSLYSTEFWMDQLDRDPEKGKHRSYELFWIWLNKCWCTTEAIRLNFFDSDLFLWSDIGAFREGNYNYKTLILHPEQVPPHEMIQMAHTTPNPPEAELFHEKMKHLPNFYHSGMQFAAYKDTWKTFYEHFLDTIDRFLEHDMLICDDQVILQSVCLSHPDICAYVLHSEVNDKRYRGLRYVLHHGGEYNLWRYNKTRARY